MKGSIEEYLISKGASPQRAGSGQLLMRCFWHSDDKGKGKLYVNAEHGAYSCKAGSCGASGGFRDIMRHFGDDKPREVVSDEVLHRARRSEILTDYVDWCHQQLLNNSDMFMYLMNRGIHADIIERYKMGYHPSSESDPLPKYGKGEVENTHILTKNNGWFLAGKIVIPYISNGQVLAVRGKDPMGKYETVYGDPARLFNVDALKAASSVFLTEGEFDSLVVQSILETSPESELRNIAVVGLAGLDALPGGKDVFKSLMSQYKRVYVGFDADNAGRNGTAKMRELLGPIVKAVEIPQQDADWTDWVVRKSDGEYIKTWRDLQGLIQEAENRDKQVFTMRDAFESALEERAAGPGLKLGFPELDSFFPKGIRRGQLVIPLAGTGVGKSLFIQNILWNTRDRRNLLVTPELTRAEVWERMVKIMRFHQPWVTHEEDFLHELQSLRVVEENKIRPADLRRFIEDYGEQYGDTPEVLHLDYLGYMARHAPGKDEYEKITNATMDLKALGKEYGMVVMAPAQVNRTGDAGESPSMKNARGGGTIEETADVLLGLSLPWMKDSTGEQKSEMMVKILKSRAGNQGRAVTLLRSAMSLAISDRTIPGAALKIDAENQAFNRRMSYEDWWGRRNREAVTLRQAQNQLDVPF